MGKHEQYPVFGGAPKPASTSVVGGGAPGSGKGGGFEMTFGKALIGVVLGVPILFILAALIVGNNGEENRSVQCDARSVELREQWLITAAGEFENASPHDSGLRGEGPCTVEIVSRNLSCDENSVMTQEIGSPFLKRALQHGFTTYVCVDVSTERRVEYPLGRVFGR